MTLQIVEVINDTDGTFRFTFSDSSGDIDLTATGITKVIVDYDGTDLDSTTATAGAIDYATEGADGIIVFKLGHESIPVGNYTCTIYIYDTIHPGSQEWPVQFQMNVLATKVG